ncbi:MAG: PspC domain-containing protein [Candidatus Kerfeldbacteria bacterium]|nr:PspC domain-containing protein [Candidatus Kerfeldbacteria bacterium]
MANEPKKLQRSRTNRVIAGVCGGLARYFNLDPTLVRVGFAILTIFWGSGIVLYILLWVIIPLEGKDEHQPSLGNRVRGTAEEMRSAAQKFARDLKKSNKQ